MRFSDSSRWRAWRRLAALVSAALVVLGLSAGAASAHDRRMTFVNHTAQTIWVAATPASVSGATGWTVPAGASVSTEVTNNYNGRIWGRTGCGFNAQGKGHCETGDCGGLYQCTGWGQIPATLAELNLDAWRHLDFYDVSMVDGSNLPMYINTTGGKTPDKITTNGCEPGHGCTTPVKCPVALQVKSGGVVVACISPCARFATDRYCCRGKYAQGCSPATTWPIDYALVFKRAEPYAYSWSGDNATSVFTCTGDCSYRIVFGLTPPAVGGAPG